MHSRLLIQHLIALLLLASNASGLETARPVPIDNKCSQEADAEHWTLAEQFVWNKVCIGDDADFNTRLGSKDLDPKLAGDFPQDRILRSAFLETILLEDKYRRSLTRRGIRIIGARFADKVDLEKAELRHSLSLLKCQLDGGVNFFGLTSTHAIIVSQSRVRWINMQGARIAMNVTMRGNAFARHEDGVSISLSGAHIQGSLDLARSIVEGNFAADTIEVEHAVYLNEGAKFLGGVDISFAKIGETLNLAGGTFHHDVDVTRTQIGADLNLGSESEGQATWQGDPSPTLYLHNARADSIPSLSGQWPPNLDLNGFTYRSVEASTNDNVMPPDAIERWFKRQREYSAQPYEQLAQVFYSRGAIETATNIRFAGRDRERRKPNLGWGRYVWLTALYGLIGYGYHPELALVWIAVMISLGAAVLSVSGQGRANGLPYGIAYSFDMLLPIIKLREKHYKIDLSGWARYYFYGHRVAGWVLASFLIAGVSGLTK